MTKKPAPAKVKFDITQYNSTKDLREKNRLKLFYPTLVKVLVAIPVAYFLFLIIYFLTTAKNLPER